MVRLGLLNQLIDNNNLSQTVICTVLGAALLTGCTTFQTTKPEISYGVPATNRTIAQRILDQSIVNTAKTNINAMDPTLFKRSRIDIDSFYSEILLTGEVPDEESKEQIMRIVSAMPDVKRAYNYLNVGPIKGTSYTVHDGYISSKINAKILANNGISNSQVKVITDDGIVYVMGKLTPTQRGHLVNIVERTVGIKELVLLTELIDDYGAKINEDSITQEEGLEPPVNNGIIPNFSPAPVNRPTAPVRIGNQFSQTAQPEQAQPQSNSTNNQAINQPINTTPQQDIEGAGSTNNQNSSPYIELYKEEVSGW